MSTVPTTPFSVSLVSDRAAVAGGIDVASAWEVEASARELIERGVTTLVVDLTEVDFIDSTGMRALLRLRDEARQAGTELELVAPEQRQVLRIFDVTGTYGLFDWRE
jgi:anti-anti-sigma factor